jgi:hypothetical protein
MMEFPELRGALLQLALDSAPIIAQAQFAWMGIAQWSCDPDGVFRDIERPTRAWDLSYHQRIKSSKTWARVEEVFQNDERLSRQISGPVSTAQSGLDLEAFRLASHIFPDPDEHGSSGDSFDTKYAELDRFLAAEELRFKAVWPVPRLAVIGTPLQMEPGVELDIMTDDELTVALRLDMVRPIFPNFKFFQPTSADRTCLRYHYRLTKLVGEGRDEVRLAQARQLEQRLNDIRSTIEEALALVLTEPMMPTGRFVLSDEEWNPDSDGAIWYQPATVPHALRLRYKEMDSGLTSDLQEIWHHLSKREIIKRCKGLPLAMRRLSFQAQRERPEDELLDTMIAAEALYLTELGNETYRGELRYRLALRAAIWADEAALGLTKREVLKLMQSAYDARSAIAHGGSPDPKIIKIKGVRVELLELAKKAKEVISAGCRKALTTAASGQSWPPDWDSLILAGSMETEAD